MFQVHKEHITKDELTVKYNKEMNVEIPEHLPKYYLSIYENCDKDKSALVFKCHHSIADGLACVFAFMAGEDGGMKKESVPYLIKMSIV